MTAAWKNRGGAAFRLATLCGLLLLLSAPVLANIYDDFDRPDSLELGTGWIEKNADAFQLSGGEIVKTWVSSGYRDNLVYRPAAEDVADVEASVELRLLQVPPGYPQIWVRVQSDTADLSNTLDGYILYVNNSATQAILGRQRGVEFVTTLATLNISPALNTTDVFRLRLRATESDPVAVNAYVERLTAAGWEAIAQSAYLDASPARVANAGSVGFGGYVEDTYAYDNFTRSNLDGGATNPLPVLSTMLPGSVEAGSSDFLLTLTGSGFVPGSLARWNGEDRPTTFVSPVEVLADISAADIASPGSAAVAVYNPGPGGGLSSALTFAIDDASSTENPVPAADAVSPSSAVVGGNGFSLTINGGGFVPTSVVLWNGGQRPTTFVSSAELQADIASSDIAAAGTATISVVNPSPGGGESDALAFEILPPLGDNYVDGFGRGDGADIGGGWVEKSPAAFDLADGAAAKRWVSTGYLDNLVYRPASEDVRDVEASVELRLLATPPGYPQIFVRLQSDTVGITGTLDGYMLYLNNSGAQAILGRQRGSEFVTALSAIDIAPGLNTFDTYRLRLQATGANPVQLSAYVERLSGSGWETIGQASYADASANRIATAGSVGFGGYVEDSYVYDNFRRSNLAGGDTGNPIPILSALTPGSAYAGGSGFTLTLSGSGFIPESVVRWDGLDRPTTFISPLELLADISAADIASPAAASVGIYNPGPGGGMSGAQSFVVLDAGSVQNPVPVVDSLLPSTADAGDPAFSLAVNGSGFVPTSVVLWNGEQRPTTFVASDQLGADISSTDIAAAGTATVSVFTPSPGGGASVGRTFSVTDPVPTNNPAPVILDLSPASATAGDNGFSLTVWGAGFVAGSVARWNGADLPTTFVSYGELRADVSAANVSGPANNAVTVYNPSPGGGLSNTVILQVTGEPLNPTPAVAGLSPESAPVGGAPLTMLVTGADFVPESVARWNGAPRPTAFVSPTEVLVDVTAEDIASAGVAAVTVVSPTPGGGVSNPQNFFVLEGTADFFSDGFNRPNSPDIGNDWTEKYEPAFSIQNGEVLAPDTPVEFHDAIVYRPLDEDRRDVEASIEFTRLPGVHFPQVHTRVQRDSVDQPATLGSYIFYVMDWDPPPGGAVIAVQPPEPNRGECVFYEIPFSSALEVGERYRLRFQVTGDYPVVLTGLVEWFDGAQWQPVASGSTTHDDATPRDPDLFCDGGSMPAPILDPGAVGFAKWTTSTDALDNFYWTDAQYSNSVPVLDSLSFAAPASTDSPFALVAQGREFTPQSVVRWNGQDRPTIWVSPRELRASVTATDATAATAAVTVFTPRPGGGTSAERSFAVPGSDRFFLDEFARLDTSSLDNGWVEKNPQALYIVEGAVDKQPVSTGYWDNLAYRPASEDRPDVETSVEIRLTQSSPGYPLIAVRVQQDTVPIVGTLDAYIFYLDNSTSRAVVGRQLGSGFSTPLGIIDIAPAMNTTDTYRLRLRATGTAPVSLSAYVERLDGTVWEIIGRGAFTDAAASRIDTTGAVGFAGHVESGYSYDNFRRLDISP